MITAAAIFKCEDADDLIDKRSAAVPLARVLPRASCADHLGRDLGALVYAGGAGASCVRHCPGAVWDAQKITLGGGGLQEVDSAVRGE
jgi:hypothetical protein